MKLKNLLTSIFLLPVVGIMGLLTGCGGGGGGSSATIGSFVKWSAITPPATVTISGISEDADYVAPAPAYTVTSVTDGGFSSSASASISYRSDGSISRISVTTPNGTVLWDEGLGDLIDDTDPYVVAAENVAGTSFAIAVDPVTIGWEYQTFGAWETGRGTGTGTIGSISVGAPTAGSAIPSMGNVTFTGATVGLYLDASGANDYITASELTVGTDFAARSLAFTTANTEKVHVLTAVTSNAPDLDMSGTLTYAAGTNSFSGALTAAGGMSGNTQGRFYGPSAEELGGVFALSGSSGVESYAGAYGAAQ